MNHQHGKLPTHNSTKQSEVVNRRRQARESQPPMMSNHNIYDKTSPTNVQTNKPKQSHAFEPANRTNNKYIVQSSESEKQGNMFKSNISIKASEGNASNSMKKQEQPHKTNPTQSRPAGSSRFMSPQIKNASTSDFQKLKERKYSQQLSDISYGSRSIQQLPSANDLTSHRSNTNSTGNTGGQNNNAAGNQGKFQAQHTNNQTAPMLVKKAPRFSEPVNFSMDDWEESNEIELPVNQSTTTSEIKRATTPKQSKTPMTKSPLTPLQNPHEIPKTNSFTPSAFKKDKELKETVSTQSTFHQIEQNSKTLTRLQPKTNQLPKKAPQQTKLSDFMIGKEIGNGKFGSVYIVKHKLSGFICALKKIPKEIIKEENILNQLTRELKIQMFLDHPNIIKLYGFFHDKDNIYLLLELGSSGQLYKVIKDKEKMTEASTSYTIKQVCEAIRYLHFYKIIHRDLKPENIVIQSGTVKLCDFGWAVCRGTQLRSTFCGTPLYVSPQILKGQQYDQKIDLWAIGILTYELLFGNIPFEINREEELIKIIKQDIVFPTNIPVSAEAKDFVLRILKKNPGQRLKIGELLEHEFLKKCPELAPELENC